MIKAIFCFLSLLVVVVYSVSDETLLEQHYTQVAQFGLQTVFGENQFVVRVKPLLSPSNYKVRYTKQAKIKSSKTKTSSEKVYLLPGYPALKNLAPGQLNQYPFDSVTTLASPKLKKVVVYLVVNKALSRSKIRQARLFLKDLLGLNLERDEINIKYRLFDTMPITVPPVQKVALVEEDISFFSLPNLLYLMIGVFILLFTLVYGYFQFKRSKLDTKDDEPATINLNPSIEVSDHLRSGDASGFSSSVSSDDGLKHYFSYVNSNNIEHFIYLINLEKLNLDQIAVVASLLPLHLSRKLIQHLSVEELGRVSQKLMKEKVIDRKFLETLDLKFKSALECLIGGDRSLEHLLSVLNSRQKAELLAYTKKNDAVMHAKLRSLVLMFEDLLYLEDGELKQLISDLKMDVLGKALISGSDALVDKVKSNMTSGGRAMIEQYLTLKAAQISGPEQQLACDEVISVVKKMEERGQLSLRKKIQTKKG